MSRAFRWCSLAMLALMLSAHAEEQSSSEKPKNDDGKSEEAKAEHFAPEEHATTGSVVIGGRKVEYQAIAGTLVIHPKGWDDVPQNLSKEQKENPTEASMFFVAYFARGENSASRPLTFVYNGGPGSASLWLHMGAFGPRRVITADDAHTPPPSYHLANNEYSLLDASDLVFIDAPGAGLSRIAGKNREKAFWGVDADAEAFANFVTQFLTKYSRWNSPKYLFGESYGTTRSAALANLLETQRYVDLNGVMLLSQILAFDASADAPEANPGVDLPYELALPTYAATAWFHHKLENAPATLEGLLPEVESFALGEYADALAAGSTLDASRKHAVAQKLHEYTGLPVDYLEKADLRVNVGEFDKTLQDSSDTTTGRIDTRYTGPTMDPLSQQAAYDPLIAGIGSAFTALFNDYLRNQLQFRTDRPVKLFADVEKDWNFQHQPPGSSQPIPQTTNVMPDLAHAMKYNPQLKIQLNAGYFDLATPFFEGMYEMQHLQIPPSLQKNIEYRFYQSGHMVYLHEPSLKALHENAADFIRRTSTPHGKAGS